MSGRRTMRWIVMATVGAALLAALMVWLTRRSDETRGSTAPIAAYPPEAATAPQFAPAETAMPEAVVAVDNADTPSAQPSPTSTRLIIRVRCERDHQPAPDVNLTLRWTGRTHWYQDTLEARTGPDGTWTLDPAPPGNVLVTGDRGDSLRTEVEPGVSTDVTLVIGAGRMVRGLVVDERDQLIAGADIWLSDLYGAAHGWVIVQSDMAGRFAIEDVGRQFIGARRRGWTPSNLVRVDEDLPDEDVKLVLRPPGGTLTGRVVDESGEPLPGALVQVGLRVGWTGEGSHRGPPAMMLRAGVDGSFLAEDVPEGSAPLYAGLEGWSPWNGAVEVPSGGRVQALIVLQPGATIAGTVRNEQGAPVVGAYLGVGSDAEPFSQASCKSDAEGRYELRNLPLRGQTITATKKGTGRDTRRIDVAPGESYVWDPLLSSGLVITGRLVDEQGAPITGLTVFADHMPDDDWVGMDTVDDEGRFSIENCEDVEHVLEVQTDRIEIDALARVEGVRPGPDELRIVVRAGQRRDATVIGRIKSTQGGLVPGAVVTIMAQGGGLLDSQSDEVDSETGEFMLTHVAGGRSFVSVQAPDWPPSVIDVGVIEPGKTNDVGLLALALPGFVVVRLQLPEGVDPTAVRCATEAMGMFLGPDFSGGALERRSQPLPPGQDWVVLVSGADVAPRRLVARVDSGRDTLLDVALGPAPRLHLDFDLPALRLARLDVTLSDASGTVVARVLPEVVPDAARQRSTAALDVGLAPGHYTVRGKLNWKSEVAAEIDVLEGAVPPPVMLRIP